MKLIPEDLIAAIPESVEATRESCMEAADTALYVLFLMGVELDPVPAFPPIVSNGVELYPLPAPWTYAPPMRAGGTKIDTKEVLGNVNEWLPHVKKNAEAYNQALAVNDVPTAVRIAEQGVNDSAMIWSNTNALAMSVEDESVYRTLELSPETKEVYAAIGRLRA